ncbi:hypothetical protein INT45_003558 [Circinella minor]|uniref:Retrotransposon gag domain-containing protein n=1 Tax=Circinella minor TaxID=1195481 RepID=A0A8H7VP47_9FUNG|nr:hypothetical protein INT45_003558 [Circinella minor]
MDNQQQAGNMEQQTIMTMLQSLQQIMQQQQQQAEQIANLRTQPTRPTAHTDDQQSLAKIIRPRQLDTFHGERTVQQVEAWLYSLEKYAEFVNIDDHQMVLFAVTLLCDGAATWWRGVEYDMTTSTPSTWSEFKHVFKYEFKPANAEQLARQRLQQLHQTGSVEQYVREFRSLMPELPDMDTKDALFNFVQGLKYQCRLQSIRLIGFSTIDQYVSAITALYNEQLTAGVNVMENQPRINAVKKLLKNARVLDQQKRRDNYEDRAAGTIFDGYSTIEKLAQVVDYFLRKDQSEHYQNAMMLLLSHHCLSRGKNLHSLDLPDAQTLSLEGEGVTPNIECHALIKTCPWMTLALYLFHCWTVVQEPFPNMTKPESWYNIKLCKGDNVDNTKEMQPKAHYDAIEKGFKACHIHSMTKTHAGRQSGAKMADIRGAGESDIRRAGHWTNDALESAYLTNLPRALLRVMAGFHKDGGRFYLRHAIEKPDPKLCRKVFPMVKVWQERINQGRDHGDQSIAADGFLQMLRQLSIVFLQDSVPL